MRKNEILKAPVTKVFPLVGSPEEGKSRKIRVAKDQPYTLAVVGFRLTPQEAIKTASALLAKAQEAQEDKNGVIDMTARRKDGSSVMMIQTAVQKPERKTRSKANGVKAASGNGAAADNATDMPKPKKVRAPRTKRPAPTDDTSAAA